MGPIIIYIYIYMYILLYLLKWLGTWKKKKEILKYPEKIPYKMYLGKFMLSLSLALLPGLIYLCDAKIYGLKIILSTKCFLKWCQASTTK